MQAQPHPPVDELKTMLPSMGAKDDWEPNADPESAVWTGTERVAVEKTFFGDPSPLPGTQVHSRWTRKHLYLLFECPYRELNLKPNPDTSTGTNQLWDWDVAEAFIGSDYLNTSRYREFQVSPQGEFVDLDIDRDDPKNQKGVEWHSGFTVKARIDRGKKIWYGEMKIPFASLGVKRPKVGDQLRIGLYRIEGKEPNRVYITWRPTNASTFHVPSAFGSLALQDVR